MNKGKGMVVVSIIIIIIYCVTLVTINICRVPECSGIITEKFRIGQNNVEHYFVIDNLEISVSIEIYYQYKVGEFYEQQGNW